MRRRRRARPRGLRGRVRREHRGRRRCSSRRWPPATRLLVHAGDGAREGGGVKFVDEFRDAELGRALAARDPRHRRAGPPLQGHGGLRRAHALDLQVRRRRPAAGQRRARARPRLPGVRDPDGPRRRRHRDRPRARRDLHLLRRHAARARRRRHAARRQGAGRRRADGLLAARRAADRPREPRPRGRLLRDRLRDDGAVDGADAQAREGRGRRELLVHVQPRDDRAAAAGAARLARPAPRRLHRPRPRRDRRRRAAVRVHPRRLRQAGRHLGLRAASTCCSRCR